MHGYARIDIARRWDEFLVALRFFTRLPVGPAMIAEPGDLARAAWAFPVAGAVVGVIAAIVFAIARAFALPELVAALLAVGAGVLVTGALHEDGLADTADGFGGSDRDSKLAIMRDSRSGAFGVLALVFSVALRAAALAAVEGRWAALGALVAAHAVGRGGLPLVMRMLSAARSDGLGAGAGEPDAAGVAWAAGITALIAVVALGLGAGVLALTAAAVVMAAVAALSQREIGGHTGDVLGAIEQGGETTMLLAAASWPM